MGPLVTCAPGNTPLVSVRLADSPAIWCKLEYLNPSGSTKDRIAARLIEYGLRSGDLVPGGQVVEASSGSTSIAFALACAQRGFRFTAVMPQGVSNERILMIRAFGGEVEITPAKRGVQGAMDRAEEIAASTGAFLPRQFSNPENARAHRTDTAREILEALPDCELHAVVSGVGTGGTLVGLHAGLRERSRDIIPVLARPVEISEEMDAECCSFSSQIPGVVDGLSRLFRADSYPGLRTIEVRQETAISVARSLIRCGHPVGPSSGLNFAAAVAIARELGPEANVVTVLPDRMERYFTTALFAPWR